MRSHLVFVAVVGLTYGALFTGCGGDDEGGGSGTGGNASGGGSSGGGGSGGSGDPDASSTDSSSEAGGGCCDARPEILAKVADAGGDPSATTAACTQFNSSQYPPSVAKDLCESAGPGEKWCKWTCP
jgi:hypothetical protein